MARIGAGQDKVDQRLNPDGSRFRRASEQGAAKPKLIEGRSSNNSRVIRFWEGNQPAPVGRHGLVREELPPTGKFAEPNLSDVAHAREGVLPACAVQR